MPIFISHSSKPSSTSPDKTGRVGNLPSLPKHLSRQLDVGRKAKEGEINAGVLGFLTGDPNAEVKRVPPKAMPVILTMPGEVEMWMNVPVEEVLKLQPPLWMRRFGSSRAARRKTRPGSHENLNLKTRPDN